MVNVDTTSLEAQLRLAEEAENQVQKLESLASDAPRPVSYTHLTLPTICSV